jgi:hypothetical protein
MTYRQVVLRRTNPSLQVTAPMWDAPHVAEPAKSAIAKFLEDAVDLLPRARDHYDRQLQAILGTKGKPIYDVQRGKVARPGVPTLRAMADALEQPFDLLMRAADGEWVSPIDPKRAQQSEPIAQEADAGLVEIQQIDLAYGLGSTFADSPVDIDVLKFPRVWVESITLAPASLLTWTRGRGDSMHPTIDDGDLILLDRSQRKVGEQDALWAFTVGDTASIKRLRVKGDRFKILSDNSAVPPDEEPIDFVNIVARVVFVGKRK